jgi:hypothetical protein
MWVPVDPDWQDHPCDRCDVSIGLSGFELGPRYPPNGPAYRRLQARFNKSLGDAKPTICETCLREFGTSLFDAAGWLEKYRGEEDGLLSIEDCLRRLDGQGRDKLSST